MVKEDQSCLMHHFTYTRCQHYREKDPEILDIDLPVIADQWDMPFRLR
jgi:hypothetical protein